ncbi:hypothetical protein GCM10010429_43420 [Micromonospora olivasterospora]
MRGASPVGGGIRDQKNLPDRCAKTRTGPTGCVALPAPTGAAGVPAGPARDAARDGHGLAHPRRFGLACHLGVVTGLPAIGVGKTPLVGRWEPPGPERGSWSPLRDGDEVVGRVLRAELPLPARAGNRYRPLRQQIPRNAAHLRRARPAGGVRTR